MKLAQLAGAAVALARRINTEVSMRNWFNLACLAIIAMIVGAECFGVVQSKDGLIAQIVTALFALLNSGGGARPPAPPSPPPAPGA